MASLGWVVRYLRDRLVGVKPLPVGVMLPQLTIWVEDYTYAPKGPYITQWAHENRHPDRMELAQFVDLDEAILDFYSKGLPPRPYYIGKIYDSNNRVILWWALTDRAREATFGVGAIMGVETVFERIEALDVANPVDRAIWETQARRNMGLG